MFLYLHRLRSILLILSGNERLESIRVCMSITPGLSPGLKDGQQDRTLVLNFWARAQ